MSARTGGMWNKFTELSGMVVKKQGWVYLQSEQERFACYVRQGLLHCCETLERTVADEAALYRVKRCTIYVYYICTYHISYTEYIQDIKLVHMRFEANTPELASLTQERSIQSMFTQDVTRTNTKLCLNVGNWAGLTPPKVKFICLIYFHYYITLF